MPYYRFTGKELDPETGLYYFGARYYDPVLSRWISAEPALAEYLPIGHWQADRRLPGFGGIYNPGNFNLYGYTHNNPVKLTDPEGKIVWVPVLLAAWAVYEVASSAYDIYTAVETVADPQATPEEKTIAVGGALLSVVGPGGSYGAVGKKVAKEVVEHTAKETAEKGLKQGVVEVTEKAAKKGEPPQLARGKRAHREEPIQPGEVPEVRTPSGKRMDRYDPQKGHIREIKPDSPREVRRGEKQVEQYKQEMEQSTGRPHTTEVTTYDPKKYE